MPSDPFGEGSAPVASSKGAAYWNLCVNVAKQSIEKGVAETSSEDNIQDQNFVEKGNKVRRLSDFMAAAENHDDIIYIKKIAEKRNQQSNKPDKRVAMTNMFK